MEWNKILSDKENKKRYTEYVNEWENKIHSFLEFDLDRQAPAQTAEQNVLESEKESATVRAAQLISGMPYAVKDNIAVKGYRLTCGSKMLKDFVSPYNATVIEKLNTVEAVPVGKCNMDEFAMGYSASSSALAATSNPRDLERSSDGCAAGVAAGIVPFALGSDTGGDVRQPASLCGIYGLKPTYGSVSRYGLVAHASSFDVIGVLSKELTIVESVFNLIKGKDEKDHTTAGYPLAGKSLSQKSVFGYLGGDIGLSEPVKQAYKNNIDILKAKGYGVKEVTFPLLEYVTPVYYTIAAAEASASLAKYNGIRYGYRSKGTDSPLELMKKTRREAFGDEVKLRILLGTYVLRSGMKEKYFIKAQKIRTKIIDEINSLFKSVDLLVLPVFPTTACKHNDAECGNRVQEKFTAIANLAGIPALSFPAGIYDNLPVGLQFLAPQYEEKLLFQAAEIIAKEIATAVPNAPGFKTIEEICTAGR